MATGMTNAGMPRTVFILSRLLTQKITVCSIGAAARLSFLVLINLLKSVVRVVIAYSLMRVITSATKRGISYWSVPVSMLLSTGTLQMNFGFIPMYSINVTTSTF